MKFCSFASGSSGNCYYIGTDSTGILIDAGISVKSIRKNLKNIGVDLSQIHAVFLTHDHFDHIASVGTLGEVYHIPVFSTAEVLDGVNRCYKVTEKLYQCRREMSKGSTEKVAGLRITSFPVSHDSTDIVGYSITDGVTTVVIATDMGCINDEAVPFLLKADHLVLEANYDEERLLEGPYPLYLKKRILSDTGHLANHVAAEFLAVHAGETVWKHVYFGHMSKENNTPDLILKQFDDKMREYGVPAGFRPPCTVLPRTSAIALVEC